MKKIAVLCISLLLLLCGCSEKKNPIVTMEFENYGEIKIELYPDIAPNTVANFVNLVQDGFYDDNMINRVQEGFVVQGGAGKDINYTIKGEFTSNGFENNLTHERGVISMARTQDPNSAGGQFFIVLDDLAKASLDGSYAGFGKVIEGFDVIEKIENADYKFTEEENSLKQMGFLNEDEYIKITKATVDTFGRKYKTQKITVSSH